MLLNPGKIAVFHAKTPAFEGKKRAVEIPVTQPPVNPEKLQTELDRVAAQWDENSDTWTRVTQSGQDAFRREMLDPAFFKLLGPVDGLKVLDAGCGEGALCRQLAEKGAQVTGVDLSPMLVDAARKTESPTNATPIDYQVGSFTDLTQFKPASFDRVVCTMALMDSPDLAAALQAFQRILKPGGKLVFSIKHPMTTLAGLNYRIAPAAADKPGRLEMSFNTGYFDMAPFEKTVEFEAPDRNGPRPTIRTIHYPRTLSIYFNELKKAGLQVEQMDEPAPSDVTCQERPYLRPFQRIPFSLMIKAVKTAENKERELSEFQKNHVVYGGTFDPFHLQHYDIVKAVSRQFKPKRLLVIPAADPPHKAGKKDITPHSVRVKMLKKLYKGNRRVVVSDMEKNLPAPSFTVQTLRALVPGFDTLYERTKEKVVMIIGEDSKKQLHKWKDAPVLFKNVLFLVSPRPQNTPEDIAPSGPLEVPSEQNEPFEWLPIKMGDRGISASAIRQKVKDGISLKDLQRYVPKTIADFIIKHGLYKPQAEDGQVA